MFTGRKLALTLAFTVLIALAAGVSCKDFFQPNSLESIAVQPPSPDILLSQTTNLQAYGTYQDNTRSLITSGVAWSSSDPSTVSIDQNTGLATAVSIGTATITASAQGLSGTASATVFITVTSISIAPATNSITGLSGTTTTPFVVTVNGSTNVSSSATLTAYLNGVASSVVTCTYETSDPNGGSGGAGQYCTASAATAGTVFQIIATYTGTTLTATATLTVNQ
jgi:hypothetical protein